MLAITPQMRILVAVEAVDFRKGIDSLAELCRAKLQEDLFSGSVFVFRSRRSTSIKILVWNLTAITGTQANSWSYDAATNHGAYSDANGNGQSAASGGAYTYDIENRIINTGSANGNYTYGYAPGNKRVWRATWSDNSNFQLQMPATDEITFWSPTGQKMGTYQLGITWVTSSVDNSACVTSFFATQTGTNYYFGGKLIKNAPGAVYSDRLGSVGKYYPYGSDKGSGNPASGEKFTGYSQDSETGLDYAVNRYQQPGSGRFLTPDLINAGVSAKDPGSWNLYTYGGGDPINNSDPSGRCYGDMTTMTFHEGGNPGDFGYFEGECPTQSVFEYDLGQVGPGSGNNPLAFSGAYDLNNGAPGFSASGDAPGSGCRQALVDYVTETHANDLGIDFGALGYTSTSTTIAGYTTTNGVYDSQTENFLSGGNWNKLQEVLQNLGFTNSSDPMHGDYSDSWREPTGTYSLQISHNPITGAIQIDIDPHNPEGGSMLGHTWDVIRNGVTYSDTDYNDVQNHFSNLRFGGTGCS